MPEGSSSSEVFEKVIGPGSEGPRSFGLTVGWGRTVRSTGVRMELQAVDGGVTDTGDAPTGEMVVDELIELLDRRLVLVPDDDVAKPHLVRFHVALVPLRCALRVGRSLRRR